MPPRHLFVYGTLMSSATGPLGRAQRVRLAREGRSLGAASVQGRLYDLGRYPGLVDSDCATDLVHGEVYVLDDPPRSLEWLDAYEGLASGRQADDLYRRVERQVRLAAGGRIMTAWVYLYRCDVARAKPIQNGRWARS